VRGVLVPVVMFQVVQDVVQQNFALLEGGDILVHHVGLVARLVSQSNDTVDFFVCLTASAPDAGHGLYFIVAELVDLHVFAESDQTHFAIGRQVGKTLLDGVARSHKFLVF